MAKKRMFRLDVLETDAFMDMPLTTQALYFHLNLRADDDGFIGNPKQIVRTIGANQNDLDLLIAKRFVLTFDDGVLVIKHWRLHNTLSANRYSETRFLEDKSLLRIKENNSYTFNEKGESLNDKRLVETSKRQKTSNRQTIDEQKTSNRQTTDNTKTSPDKNSIGKDSIGKDRIEKGNTINSISCPVPATQDTGPAFISLPLNDKTEYSVPLSDVEEYKKLYPAVDVEQELRNMRGWCLDSPNKRKTRNGIKRFIGSWLKRQQDRGHDGYKSKGLEEFING